MDHTIDGFLQGEDPGVDNALFYHPKTLMLFGDGRDVISKLVNEVKQLWEKAGIDMRHLIRRMQRRSTVASLHPGFFTVL